MQRYEATFYLIWINRNRVLVLLNTFGMLLLIMISEVAWPSKLCMEALAIQRNSRLNR